MDERICEKMATRIIFLRTTKARWEKKAYAYGLSLKLA